MLNSKTLTIAGQNRIGDLEYDTLSIDEQLTYQLNSCNFIVKGDKPNEGDEVIIEDSKLGRMFAGTIVDVVLQTYSHDRTLVTWSVECDDYTTQLDKSLVVETYENMPADEIFKDIVNKYCPDFTVTGVNTGTPIVEMIVFNYEYPSECFKELSEYIGWQWEVDYYKDLHFFSSDDLTTPAPMDIHQGSMFRDLKHSVDMQGLRNRVYVLGGTMLSDPFNYEIEADGIADTWILPHKPHELTFNMGTVGIENQHDESEYDYLMNYQEKYVRASKHTPKIDKGTPLIFTYKFDIDVITTVEDLESQEKIASIQGNDGIYEHVIEDDSLITIEAAEAAGLADLRENANPNIKGSFETISDGFKPGQVLNIDLPDRGIKGQYLIQHVKITPIPDGGWLYLIEFGSRLKGIADFLKALVSKQQSKRQNESAVLNKFEYGQEQIVLGDDIEETYREPIFVCGDEDAICGFVQVGEVS